VPPSTYYANKTRSPSARACRDAVLKPASRQLWEVNYRVYGARKLWKAARRGNGCAPPSPTPPRATPTWSGETSTPAAPKRGSPTWSRAGLGRRWPTSVSSDAYSQMIVRMAGRAAYAHSDGARRYRDGSLVRWKSVGGAAMSLRCRCHVHPVRRITSIRYGECLAEIGAVPSIGTVGESLDSLGGCVL
jgi:putative transposase